MRAELQEQMYKLVREFQSSDQTRRSFCEIHGIKLAKFQYWSNKYTRRQEAEVGFAKLEISAPISSPKKVLTITMSNGTVIEIPV